MNGFTGHARKSQAISRRWFCALLVLVTWRGPLPLVHAHEDQVVTTGSDEELNLTLAEHLQRFHWNSEKIFDGVWHIHLVFPWSGPCSDNSSPSEPAEDLLVCSEMRVLQSDADCSLKPSVQYWTGNLLPAEAHLRAVLPTPLRPYVAALSERLSTAPLSAVLGVSLC